MKQREIARRAAVYLALLTVAVAQPLLQLYGQNVAVFAAAEYEGSVVVWFAVFALLVPPALFAVVDGASYLFLPRIEKHVHRFLVFVSLWAVMSVVTRSISFGPWGVDAMFTAALAALALIAYMRFGAVKTWFMFMSPLVLVVAVSFGMSANAVINPPDAEVIDLSTPSSSVASGPGTPKDKVSVLWIVLDEAPLFSLLKSDGTINEKRFPGFAELAASSTWYRNVIATSQTTTDAVPAMLTGKFPRAGVGPVLGNHPKNLFTLMNGHISMDAHEAVTALCPRKVCATVSVSGSDTIADPRGELVSGGSTLPPADSGIVKRTRTPFLRFLKDATVVVGHKVLPEGLREKIPPIDESWGGFVEEQSTETSDTTEETVVSTTFPETEETQEKNDKLTINEWLSGGPQTQVPIIESVISRATRSDRPTLHFVHSLLPHRPWTMTPDMRTGFRQPPENRSPDIIDNRRDRLQAYLGQMVATDSIIQNMVTSMKRSANWDRTMIIVTADHGITIQKGESLRKTINVKSPGTLEDIYRVPLFIKYPDQQSGSVSDCTASPVDLLATVSAATGVDAGWTTDGSDLRQSCPVRSTRPIVWPNGKFEMATSFNALLDRIAYYDEWIDADGDVDDIYRSGISGALVGTSVGVTSGVETGVSWVLDDPEKFQTAGTGRFAPVASYASGFLTARRDFSSTEEGLLVMDGVVFGVVSELTGMKKNQKSDFVSIPMARLQTPGAHTMELWVVNWADPTAPVFKKVAK